jgi:alkylation response protein AidB-like acyl-CoA dehydrogenase
MDFDFTNAQQAFRREVRAWLTAHVPADLKGRGFAASRADRAHVDRLRGWQRALHEAGYVGLDWPREYGGRGASIMEQTPASSRANRRDPRAPRPSSSGARGTRTWPRSRPR